MSLVTYSIPPAVAFSANPIRFRIGSDINLQTVGLYVQCNISFSRVHPTGFSQVIGFPLSPDAQGIIDLDIRRIVHRLLEYSLPAPTDTQQTHQANNQTGLVRVSFTEYSQDLPTGGTPVVMSDIVVVRGGISHEMWQQNTWFSNRYPANPWLTWKPATRQQQPHIKDYISYLHLGATTTSEPKLEAEIIFTDNSSAIHEFPISGDELAQNHVYHLPAGYANLNLADINPAKKVWKYSLRVKDINEYYSPAVTFVMDYSPVYEPIYLHYFNSLGGFETVALTGEHSQNAGREYDMVDINASRAPINAPVVPAMSRMNRVTEQITYKANIGVTHDWDLQDLRRDLFLSEEIYILKNNRWWPVHILDKSLDMGTLNAMVKDLQIEYAYAFSNNRYTPEAAALGEPEGFQFTVQCPVITYTVTDTTVQVSFVHVPAPIMRYSIQLLSEAGTLLSESIKNIPYTNPITHIFTGLTPETTYRARIVLQNTETGESRACTYGNITTNEDGEGGGDPQTPDYYTHEVRLAGNIADACPANPTTVYSADSTLTIGSYIWSNTALDLAILGFTHIVIPDGYIYTLDGNQIVSQTFNIC